MLTEAIVAAKDVVVSIDGAEGFGDRLMTTHFPENFFHTFGKKCVIPANHDVFAHNPYVERKAKLPAYHISIYRAPYSQWARDRSLDVMEFQTSLLCQYWGLKEVLTRQRVYFAEELPQQDYVVIHTQGKTVGGLNGHEVTLLEELTKAVRVFQVGGMGDVIVPGVTDLRGKDFDATAAIIASARAFIGVNSGMMHLAGCYPQVKRYGIVVERFRPDFTPQSFSQGTEWWAKDVNFFSSRGKTDIIKNLASLPKEILENHYPSL